MTMVGDKVLGYRASAKVTLTRTCNMREKLGCRVHVRVDICMSGCEVVELSDRCKEHLLFLSVRFSYPTA